MKYCQKCGAQNPDEAKFCVECGYNFEGNVAHESIDSKKYIEIIGDQTWYAIKQPTIQFYVNNILIGEVDYKGRTRIKISLPCNLEYGLKVKGFKIRKHSIYIPDDFDGLIQLESSRWTGQLIATLVAKQ